MDKESKKHFETMRYKILALAVIGIVTTLVMHFG